jgi:hypothetical protein
MPEVAADTLVGPAGVAVMPGVVVALVAVVDTPPAAAVIKLESEASSGFLPSKRPARPWQLSSVRALG